MVGRSSLARGSTAIADAAGGGAVADRSALAGGLMAIADAAGGGAQGGGAVAEVEGVDAVAAGVAATWDPHPRSAITTPAPNTDAAAIPAREIAAVVERGRDSRSVSSMRGDYSCGDVIRKPGTQGEAARDASVIAVSARAVARPRLSPLADDAATSRFLPRGGS